MPRMTPEEAYQEALRRIRESEKTGAVELDRSHGTERPPDLKH
jgi:hypothetical protein